MRILTFTIALDDDLEAFEILKMVREWAEKRRLPCNQHSVVIPPYMRGEEEGGE